MPTFGFLVIFLSIFLAKDIFAGYATFYDLKLSSFSKNSCCVSKKIGIQHVFSDLSFRSVAIGDYYGSDGQSFMSFDLGYGTYWSISRGYKLITSLHFDGNYDFDNTAFLRSIGYFGIMKRLSSRFSTNIKLGLPLVTFNRRSSFITSIELNYFYGSGIAYREATATLKNVKKKFLWILWFYD